VNEAKPDTNTNTNMGMDVYRVRIRISYETVVDVLGTPDNYSTIAGSFSTKALPESPQPFVVDARGRKWALVCDRAGNPTVRIADWRIVEPIPRCYGCGDSLVGYEDSRTFPWCEECYEVGRIQEAADLYNDDVRGR